MKYITSILLLLVSIVALSGCELGDKKSLKECAESAVRGDVWRDKELEL